MSTFRHLLLSAKTKIVYPANATVWEVTIPEGGATYMFYVYAQTPSQVTVDFGDGTVEVHTGGTNVSHTYAQGVYTVSVTGDCREMQLASRQMLTTYGQYVTAFIQVSNTLISYYGLLASCTNLTQLPNSLTIPAHITNVNGMLNGSGVQALPPRLLLHDGITSGNAFVSSTPIKYLPDGFTIPDSTAAACSRVISGCKQLLRLPESFRIPQAATDLNQFFYGVSKLVYIPKECRIPPGATSLRYLASGGLTAAVDIGELLASWNPTSTDVNLQGAFEASGVGGVAPADKLWNNPLSSAWNITGCFARAFNVENLGEIPATWGGGKILLDDTTITLSDSTVDFILLKQNVNVASFYSLYGVKVEFTGLPDGLNGAWSGNDYKITGTLPEGSYRGQFTAHVYNKYDTTGATATITLIIGGNDTSDSSGNLTVSGVSSTMAAMLTPAFVYADGEYSPVDASASGNARVWHLSNGGYDFYFQWSVTEGAWVLSESLNDPASNGFPYIYSTVSGSDPWTSSGWEYSLTGPVDISVTQG